jgi:hypothetical protein
MMVVFVFTTQRRICRRDEDDWKTTEIGCTDPVSRRKGEIHALGREENKKRCVGGANGCYIPNKPPLLRALHKP